jgi:RNA polymerase sigma-70 factor (ECF subfamily)
MSEVNVEPALVERAQRGDREAFAQLAQESSNRLFAIASRILRDFDAAGDALQGALVLIWRDLPTLRDATKFDAWTYRLLVRVCHEELRRRRRLGARDMWPSDEVADDDTFAVQQRDELERAFTRLSSDHRAVIVLQYYSDLTVPQIADALGVSEGTVKSRLHYARGALRGALEANARVAIQERTA